MGASVCCVIVAWWAVHTRANSLASGWARAEGQRNRATERVMERYDGGAIRLRIRLGRPI